MDRYKKTTSVFVCSPTNHMADLAELEAVVKRFKALGGKLPKEIELALEAAKTGRNVENALNAACTGLFEFYLQAERKCAEKVGYASPANYATGSPDQRDDFDNCLLPTIRNWQMHNINFTINPYNEKSALRVFIKSTAQQVYAIAQKYMKKAVLDQIKGTTKPQKVAVPPKN